MSCPSDGPSERARAERLCSVGWWLMVEHRPAFSSQLPSGVAHYSSARGMPWQC
jgi:hypothetical protein